MKLNPPALPSPPTGIIAAAAYGRLRELKTMLASGNDPDTKDAFGRTPLLHAATNLEIDAIRMLLEHGANPNLAGWGGNTPLLAAIDSDVIQHIDAVDAGKPLDALPPFTEALTLLLNAGADRYQADESGHNALDLARRMHPRALEELLRHVRRT